MGKELLIPGNYFSKGLVKKGLANTLSLAKDVIIFRGDHTEKKVPSGRYPVFFSDKRSASVYTRGAPEKLSSYKVIKSPKLFHLSYENLIALFSEDLDVDEVAALKMYLNVGETEDGKKFPYIVPVGFLKGKENINAKLYLNRRILNIVCRLGYDGWIVLPNEIIQRNLTMNKNTGELNYTFNPYAPEIALCHWAEFLTAL